MWGGGADSIAVTGCAASVAVSKVVGGTYVTLLTRNTRLAVTLTGQLITRVVHRANTVTFTGNTSVTEVDAVKSWLGVVAPLSRYVGVTVAHAGGLVTTALAVHGAVLVTVAVSTQSQCVVVVVGQTVFTEETASVANTFVALTSCGVTVSDSVRINVATACAFGTRSFHTSLLSGRITTVAIDTHITEIASISLFTLSAHHISVRKLDTSPTIRTWALRAVVRGALSGVSIVTMSTPLTVVAVSVVLTDAFSGFNVTSI